MLLTKCLEHEGYHVETASDGQEALDMFRRNKYDLAFLDIKMSKLSGTEVLKSIREMGIDTPVIIITAYATVKNAVECTQLGAVAYLHKPFTADKLRSVLAELKQPDGPAEAERLIAAGRVPEAMRLLKKALSDNPLDARLYRLLAEASERMGNNEDAEKYKGIVNSLENKTMS
jgi:DNA-binding NtrC family response regulator